MEEQPSLIVIGKDIVADFKKRYADSRTALTTWVATVEGARWTNIQEVRATYPHADAVCSCTVFNIRGNTYRLISKIAYEEQVVDVRTILTHAEYNKEGWKRDCNC